MFSCVFTALYAESGQWRLAILGKELFYAASVATGDKGPPLTGWEATKGPSGQGAGGAAPAPHLVAGTDGWRSENEQLEQQRRAMMLDEL